MSKDNNTVQISIYGQEYSVKAPADAEYIKKIAAYLDEKMIEVQSGFSTTQSSTRIAILAAMNITDELFTSRKDQDSGAGEVEEKDSFDVHLAGAGDKKIQVIKEVRSLTNLGLKDAKDLVDGAPSTILEGASKEDAEKAKEALEAAGATIELK